MNKLWWELRCEARIRVAKLKEKMYFKIALWSDSIGKWSYLSMNEAKQKRIIAWGDKRDRP